MAESASIIAPGREGSQLGRRYRSGRRRHQPVESQNDKGEYGNAHQHTLDPAHDALALGRPWFGHDVDERAGVLYVAAEASGGVV